MLTKNVNKKCYITTTQILCRYSGVLYFTRDTFLVYNQS